jgi:nucleotide-binding universal stress UspA family protein
VLFVEEERSWWDRLVSRFNKNPAGEGIDQHLGTLKALANGARPPDVRRARAQSVSDAILAEAQKEYDLVLLGASMNGPSIGGDTLADVVAGAPCHVAIMMTAPTVESFRRIIVPTDGSAAARLAVEFAARVAELTEAELTVAILREHRPQAEAYVDETGQFQTALINMPTPDEELQRVSHVFKAVDRKPAILHVDYDPSSSALAAAVESGKYDLIVIGAENRAVQHRLFFGYDNERIIRAATTSIAVVVPNIARLK